MGQIAVMSIGKEGGRSCLAFVPRKLAPGLASGSSGPLACAARIRAQAVSSLISGTPPPTQHA